MKLRAIRVLVALVPLVAGAGCTREAAPPPATAEAEPAAEPGVVNLSHEEQVALGLQLVHPVRSTNGESLASVGWIVAPPGSEVVVKAPATGFLGAAEKQAFPELGAEVSGGALLAQVRAVLLPAEQAQLVATKVEAETIIKQSQISIQFAQSQLDRLREAPQTVPGTRVLDLQESIAKAQATLEEARKKLPYLPAEQPNHELKLNPWPVTSPVAGWVLERFSLPGQFVVQGDAMFTVANWSVLWVRVPVLEADWPRLNSRAEAVFTPEGSKLSLRGAPISVQRATPADRRTLDLYFSVENRARELRPGQSVRVQLPLQAAPSQLEIPRAAVLWDVLGNTYVYVHKEGEQFHRQRVELGQGGQAHSLPIVRGLQEHDEIVAVGAEALYGAEFKSDFPEAE